MFKVNNKDQSFIEVLGVLAKVRNADKKTHIIRGDLSTKKTNGLERCILNCIQKNKGLINAFFNVNYKKSHKNLFEIKMQILYIKKAKTLHPEKYRLLKETFNEAVKQFNSIAPNSKLQPIIDEDIFNDETPWQSAKPNPAVASAKAPQTLPPPLIDAEEPVNNAPPPSIAAMSAKLTKSNNLLIKASEGFTLNDLLKEAIEEEQVETAQYLVQKGADISIISLRGLHPRQQEIVKWLEKWAAAPEIKPENLDYYAIDLGLGYKTANLMVLQKKADKINETLESCEMKVPPFLGIGDFEMQKTLMTAMPELETLWEKFKNSFDPNVKAQYLNAINEGDASKIPLKVSPEGQKIIDEIQSKITTYFKGKPYFTKQMEEWIKKEDPQFLIVRSTGKEDSDTNSNAGGNDSVPFIKPNAQEISRAMGQVIASYYGSKSIGQRLLAGDRSIFTEKPFIPVVLQVMVGENVGGKGSANDDIPRSGVLFTRQGDKAEGVTLIQTGLGNNEGVVSSQVDVDSYYIGSDKKIHSVVRKKATRFVSIEKGPGKYAAEAIKNNNVMLENSQALPNYVIQDLKRVADDISASYGAEKGGMKPMDMEYTVKLRDQSTTKTVQVEHEGKTLSFKKDKPVIYLLQARPLLNTATAPIPKTFLDLQALKGVKNENKLSVETLLDGNAYVRTVDNADDVLFVDTLEEGLEAYTHAPDPSKIKAIISKKTAPATSHPAVTLRPKGVAVMVISDQDQYARAREMVQKAEPHKPVLFDPQRGMVVNTEGVAKPQDMIKIGLVSYPIPLEMTVPLSPLVMTAYQMGVKHSPESKAHIETILKVQLHELNDEYFKFMQELKAAGPLPALASATNPDGATLRGLFDDMAMKGEHDAKLALGAVLQVLHKRLIKSMHETEDFRASLHLQTLQVFQEALRLTREEIIPAMEKHDPQTLNRLYPIKFLDALVFQQPAQNVVGGFSYAKILHTDKIEHANVQKGQAAGLEFKGSNALQQLQLMNMGNAAFNPKLATSWETFIKDVSKEGKIGELAPMLTEITKLNLNATWLNVTFRKLWEVHGGNTNMVIVGLKSLYLKDQKTLQWIGEMNKDLAILEEKSEVWENPDYVKKQIENLKKKYKEFGFDPNDAAGGLKARYDQSNELGKLALLQFMNRAVNVYDVTIKKVKGSALYTDPQQKRKDFAQLLEGYNTMMKASMQLISPADENTLMQPSMGSKVSFAGYQKNLHQGTSYSFGAGHYKSIGFDKLVADANNSVGNADEQFEPRPEFNVDSLIIGSKADLDFSAHWPSRLEEYFTTFHQNMEKVSKFLMTKNGFNNSILADEVNVVCTEIQKHVPKAGWGYDLSLPNEISHIGQDGEMIEVVYQVPLRQHAGTIKLRYNPKKVDKGFDISMEMFGNDEHDRWDQTAAFGALLANTWGLSYTDVKPKVNYKGKREGASFSLHVPANFAEQEKLIKTFRYIMKQMTMNSCGGADGLRQKMETHAEVNDWNHVPESFFRDAYYVSNELMNKNVGDSSFTRKIAENSLLGLAKNGLSDYTRGAAIQLPGYLGNPAYAYVKGSQDMHWNKSLVTGSTLHLIKGLQDDHANTLPVVQKLIADPDMKKNLPDTVKALQQAINSFKSPQEQFKEAYKTDFPKAVEIAWKGKQGGLMRKVQNKIHTMNSDEVTALAKALIAEGQIEALNNWILPYLPPGSKALDVIYEAKAKEARALLYKSLNANVTQLQTHAMNFNAKFDQMMNLSADTLIGLSQHGDWNEAYGNFAGLDNYLNKPKYNYVHENVYDTTTKLRKAAVLYIIRGMEDASHENQLAAVGAFSKLIEDYKKHSKHSKHKAQIQQVLVALSRGFVESAKSKENACMTLAYLWGNDKAALQEIAGSDTSGIIQKAISHC